MMKVDEVLEAARRAKDAGSTRFCMGTAWRGVGQKNAFQHILTMVKELFSDGRLTGVRSLVRKSRAWGWRLVAPWAS